MFIYIELAVITATGFEWISGTTFSVERNNIAKHSFETMAWTFFSSTPILMFLISFYVFITDMVDYYNSDARLGNGYYTPILLSYYPT